MKRIILLYVLNVVLILLYTTSSLVGQIIDAKYLTPKFIDNTNNYSYTIFGSPVKLMLVVSYLTMEIITMEMEMNLLSIVLTVI